MTLERFKKERRYFALVVAGGFYLAFIAGFTNVISLDGISGDPVTHVTGTVSRIGMHIVHEQSNLPNEVFLVTCFIFGSFISALLVGETSFKKTRPYGIIMIIDSLLIVLVIVVYNLVEPSNRGYVKYILALNSGIQNAMVTSYTGAVLRTTHITGISTDIGIVLARIVRSKGASPDAWKLKYLVPLFMGFLLGCTFGALAFPFWGIRSLLFCAISQLVLGAVYIIWKITNKKKLKENAESGSTRRSSEYEYKETVTGFPSPLPEANGKENAEFASTRQSAECENKEAMRMLPSSSPSPTTSGSIEP